MIVQEKFFVPDDMATRLATGVYQITGGVIRYASGPRKGQIVKHLEPVNSKIAVPQFVKHYKKGIIITIVGVATIGTGLFIYNQVKNREPKSLTEFRIALRVYVAAIRNGNMDIDKINDLMDCLRTLKAHKDYARISIQLTTEELEVLVGCIYEYTVKLARDNNVELSDENFDIVGKNNEDIIINLETYLSVQKRIFSEVG